MNQEQRITKLEKEVVDLKEQINEFMTTHWILKKSEEPYVRKDETRRVRGTTQYI